jgi:hypothetical protein
MKKAAIATAAILVVLVASTAIAGFDGGPRRGGDRIMTALEAVTAFAALDGVSPADGWGRVAITDMYNASGTHRVAQVWLYELQPWTRYVVEIDGVLLGAITTRQHGSGSLRLDSDGGMDGHLPTGLPPAWAITRAMVFDSSPTATLQGDFSTIERGGGDGVYEEEIALLDVTGGSAVGMAKVEIDDDGGQEFKTRATGLISGESYSIVVGVLTDTLTVGVVVADAEGQAGLQLEHPDDDHPLPPELMPVSDITDVEWYDSTSALLLAGSFTGTNQEDEIEVEGAFAGLTGDDSFLLDTDEGQLTIIVDDDTELDGFDSLSDLEPGDWLYVEGWMTPDGILAEEIELDDDD